MQAPLNLYSYSVKEAIGMHPNLKVSIFARMIPHRPEMNNIIQALCLMHLSSINIIKEVVLGISA